MKETFADLDKKFPGGLVQSSFKDTDYPKGNVYWMRFAGAHCPICGKTDWCCVNVTGTKVVCMRVDNGTGKKIGNGYLYELTDGMKVEFDASKVKPKQTVPYADDNVLDAFYRMILMSCPLTAEHLDNLKKRGLTEEQIHLHQYRGFGSYYQSPANIKKHHAGQLRNVKFGRDDQGDGTVISRWTEVLKKLQLPQDTWKGVPGFYQKKVKLDQELPFNIDNLGKFSIKPGQYEVPVFESNAEGMLVPYYNEYNQLVGFQIRVDYPKVWVKVIKQPKKTYVNIRFKPGTKDYEVVASEKGESIDNVVSHGTLKNDHDEVKVRYALNKEIVFKPHVGGKYFWVSSSQKEQGAEGKTPIQVSYNPEIAKLQPNSYKLRDYVNKPKSVWLTEGGLKAIVATNNLSKNFTQDQLDKYGRDFLAVAGVSSYRKFLPMLKKLNVDRVTIAFDMDFMNKPQVGESLASLINLLRKEGYKVTVAFWREDKGIDDALVNGSEIRFKEL